ncbi:hypothetical protein EWZ69_03420, partial [Helicobacter pylori]|nr:hypothetical protein [Helicobacter pylori]NHA84413.1 hypothetical protein [Helicobacter pylori]
FFNDVFLFFNDVFLFFNDVFFILKLYSLPLNSNRSFPITLIHSFQALKFLSNSKFSFKFQNI